MAVLTLTCHQSPVIVWRLLPCECIGSEERVKATRLLHHNNDRDLTQDEKKIRHEGLSLHSHTVIIPKGVYLHHKDQ